MYKLLTFRSPNTIYTYRIEFDFIHSLLNTSITGRLTLKPSRRFPKPTLLHLTEQSVAQSSSPTFSKLWRVQYQIQTHVLSLYYHSMRVTTAAWVRQFKTHAAFRLMFISFQYGSPTLINLNGRFRRWRHTYLFLFNLFYATGRLPTFGSKVFKTEILALNYSFNLLNYTAFKYASPFFTFTDEAYGASPSLILRKWQKQNTNFAFMLELKIFKKLQHFLKTLGTFVIGLVPLSANPWLVSFPIPAFSDTKLIQYYFLKLITFIRQDASRLRFRNKLNLWLL